MKKTTKSTHDIAVSILSAIVRVILILLIVTLSFTACALAYDRLVVKSEIPSVFGYSLLVIATPSMTGSINAGDAVIVKNASSYAVGDVVTYFPAGESTSVTHRIVRTEGDRFYTKGDANESEDPNPVYAGQIAGKVTTVIPKAGFFIEWLRTPTGIVFATAILAILVAIGMVGGKKDDKGAFCDAEL